MLVAPEINEHPVGTDDPALATTDVQLYHWYESIGAGAPSQLPGVAAIDALVEAVAGIVGTDAATGAEEVSTAVAPEKRTVAPAEFVAVIDTIT